MITAGGRERLTIVNVDTSDELVVQHDPAMLRLQDGATWHPRGQVERPGLEYERGRPATLSLRLVFDTTRTREDVGARGVDALRALLARVAVVEDGESIWRPPHLLVRWGATRFPCVLSELDVSYLLFRPCGQAVRAEVSLVLLERQDGSASDASSMDRAEVSTVVREAAVGRVRGVASALLGGAPEVPVGGGAPSWGTAPVAPWHGDGW